MKNPKSKKKIRYAVVGLGDIAQGAVLPGFSNASANSELVALISDDPKKLKQLEKIYRVEDTCGYDGYDVFLRSGKVDAVYLALPNSLHREYAVRAANAGIHVLSEKPLAVTEDECTDIIRACAENKVKLMTAYRLHFERANLEAVHILQSGKIGDPRIFQSLFTMQAKAGNIRLSKKLGGGGLYDIGVYCINAARYLFRDEPTEVFAYSAKNDDPRFKEVEEMTSAMMCFPKDRLASFTTSFGAADSAVYTVVGTRGLIRMNHSYEYSEPIEIEIVINGETQRRKYALRDQFGPEILYFSDCILRNKEPEPSGIEGLLDVHIIRSLYESVAAGIPIKIKELHRQQRPSLRQEIHRFPVRRPRKIRASSPSRK
jgi:glucose-fructose oxidoreductase